MLRTHPFMSNGEICMNIKLDRDSMAALKLLAVAVNDLIDAIVSLHGCIEDNTMALRELYEGAK